MVWASYVTVYQVRKPSCGPGTGSNAHTESPFERQRPRWSTLRQTLPMAPLESGSTNVRTLSWTTAPPHRNGRLSGLVASTSEKCHSGSSPGRIE